SEQVQQEIPADEPTAGWVWSPMSSHEFFSTDFKPTWLVKRVLVKNQPGVVGGPIKCLKTTIGIDLAVSLASGTPFLGFLEVYRPVRVAVLSGESGSWTLQETARRICAARGIDPTILPLSWQTSLPKLADPVHRGELARGLRTDSIDVVVIDPLY